MNPLTLVKRIQKITSTEAALGMSEDASWHAKYKDSAYVFVGGIPYDLTEGDLLAVFAQYGEIVDVNLVRDKATGKSKGFAFLAYEDQRSTVLAVDNLNGAKVLGRIIRVDHVNKYKKKEEEEEDDDEASKEARGVCRAFQRGQCFRGASCKFYHSEQLNERKGLDTEAGSRLKWHHDKYDDTNRHGYSRGKGLESDAAYYNKDMSYRRAKRYSEWNEQTGQGRKSNEKSSGYKGISQEHNSVREKGRENSSDRNMKDRHHRRHSKDF